MANTLQIKRGANADLPTLNAGEFGFSTDTHQIYIGDGVDNHEIAKVGDVHYVGTTEIANNRASSAQGLDGITSLTPGADFTLVSALGDALKMTNASGNISLFSDSASGETPSFSISGFKTGDALRTVDFDFADVADTLSITGASNYYIDGNLGIGSTIPQKKLHINYGDLRISYGPTSNFDVSQTSTGGVVNIRNSSGVSVIGLDARTNTGSPAFSVIGKDSLSTTIVGNISGSTGTGLVVTGAGNAGIGTTSPQEKSHIIGNSEISVGDSKGGLVMNTVEAAADITAAVSITINVNIPVGAKMIAVQLRVDEALTGGETWDAEWNDGATVQSIATAQAVSKNTKVNAFFDENAATAITDAETDIVITKNGGGAFTAAGNIRAVVYYQTLDAMGDAS